MLTKPDLIELVTDTLYPRYVAEATRLEVIDKWYRWDNTDVIIPSGSTIEHKSLLQLAKTPWLGLVVTNVAQAMFGDGYKTAEADDDETTAVPWKLWNANDLDNRQVAIHRATLAYGYAYGTALPGVDDAGAKSAVLRGVSPRKMLAFYADPAEDDWPVYAIRIVDATRLRVYDGTHIYHLKIDTDGKYIEDRPSQEHEAGVCPVVRYCNMLDLDGRSDGEVEPFIPLAKRIDKTIYDRLLTQHYNSWKVRTVAGMSEPETVAAATLAKMKLAHDSLLVSDSPDTKFGSLPETPLDGFIRAYESDIKTLAAATQTPVHALVGDLINLSAEALAAARASLDAKVAERQRSFGKSHGQLLRLGCHIMGAEAAARDVYAHLTWADTSIRSMNSAADALGKMATMLGVPPRALWGRIPGVTKTDVAEWKQIAESDDVMGQLLDEINRSGTPADAV